MDDEFSHCDEEQLVHAVEKVENGLKRPKLDFICGKIYRQKRNKIEHMKTHCTSFKCRKCDIQFSRDYTKNKCTYELQKSKSFTCKHCGAPFDTYDALFQHVIEKHPLKKENIQKGCDVHNSVQQRT